MHQLIITKEMLEKFAALKPGREEHVELTDRDTDAPPDRTDRKIPFRVQGLVGGGVALLEPSREALQKVLEAEAAAEASKR